MKNDSLAYKNLQLEYELMKKDIEIKQFDGKLNEQSVWATIIIGAVTIFTGSVIIFQNWRYRKYTEEKLKTIQEEIETKLITNEKTTSEKIEQFPKETNFDLKEHLSSFEKLKAEFDIKFKNNEEQFYLLKRETYRGLGLLHYLLADYSVKQNDYYEAFRKNLDSAIYARRVIDGKIVETEYDAISFHRCLIGLNSSLDCLIKLKDNKKQDEIERLFNIRDYEEIETQLDIFNIDDISMRELVLQIRTILHSIKKEHAND